MTYARHRLVAVVSGVGLTLAACTSTVPNSAPQGVGFQDYRSYQAQRAAREAQLSQSVPLPSSLAVSDESIPGAVRTASTESTAAVPTAAEPVDVTAVALAALNEPVAEPLPDNPEISDEQNFNAVSGRESIESDAERLEEQRDAFQEVAPEALPERSGSSGPNIVAFALATNHAVGQPVYQRGRTSPARHERNCAEFLSPDRAQIAFLEMGGPERDRRGLDPDGDGYACAWDPSPFRAGRGG